MSRGPDDREEDRDARARTPTPDQLPWEMAAEMEAAAHAGIRTPERERYARSMLDYLASLPKKPTSEGR